MLKGKQVIVTIPDGPFHGAQGRADSLVNYISQALCPKENETIRVVDVEIPCLDNVEVIVTAEGDLGRE
jgi:hypothetical protein